MNKVFLLVVLLMIPFLYAEHSDMAPKVEKYAAVVNPEDSPFDLAPPMDMPHSTGRGLGDVLLTIDALALGIDGPSGISWDGQYLYVAALQDDSVYVVDPFVPAVVNRWASDTFAAAPYGCALEQNLWVTHISPDTAREYTTAGVPTGNAFSTEPCGATYCADGSEWWQDGEIWFIGVGSACGNQAFKFSVPSGTVLDSIGHPAWTYTSQRGMSYDPYNEKFWVGGSNSDSVWELHLDGSPTGRTFYFDGCTGIAYDWQSTYHPTPVLWITRQGADQILMVDADNPNPGPVTFWDFETGWQDWTNTNGNVFPYAWGVQASDLNGASWVCPDAGDSSLWIDSDAAGSGGYLLEDTALSPLLVPNPTMDWLKYGLAYNYLTTGEHLEAGIKYFDGATWTAVPLKTYTADFGPAYDSVDVSAYASYPRVQIYFFYTDAAGWDWYGAVDNVSIDATIYVSDHDVGCSEVVSPPEGSVVPGDYDVIGRIRNYGSSMETFDVTANVYDTVGMVNVFTQTVTLTDFPAAGDSNVNFGTVTFNSDSYYYTEIYTELAGDADPSNDTCSVYSTTALSLGDLIFELDVQTITGNNRLLGVEFDGANFYVTGGTGTGTNSIWVIDTLGTIVCQVAQPTSSAWGMRDLAWDDVYVGPDRIDTLYASDEAGLYKFGIDLTGVYTNYGMITGPVLPCRALAWDPDDEWFFTANWSPYYKFSKTNPLIQTQASGPGSTYGAAYDTDTLDGGWVWWHSQIQVDPGYMVRIDQMDAVTMDWTGLNFGYIPQNLIPGTNVNMAGGLCFYEGFRGMDVLFALVQGDPVDEICGLYIRQHVTAVAEQPGDAKALVFGFAPNMATVNKGHVPIAYTTTTPGHVSLKVYDGMGRLVQTLVNAHQPAGAQSLVWNNKDMHNRVVANGVYFLKLEAENTTAVHKMILVK